jgi:hypothetical protein
MSDNIMLITGLCALLFAGVMFRLARPPSNVDTGMMEGYFYVQSASYTGAGSRSGARRGVPPGVRVDGAGGLCHDADVERTGTGSSTALLGGPVLAYGRDSAGGARQPSVAATAWTNEAMGQVIISKLNDRYV